MSKSDYNEKNEPVEIDDVIVKAETALGLLIEVDGDRGGYRRNLSMTTVKFMRRGTSGTLIIPRWLAREKGSNND